MQATERWSGPAIAIVLVELVCVLIVSQAVGHYALPPIPGYARIFSVLAYITFLTWALCQLVLCINDPSPLRAVRDRAIASRDVLPPVAIGFLLCFAQKVALTWLKPALPMAAGFWADPMLADVERRMIGVDAWRIAHAINPPRELVEYPYNAWFLTIIAVLMACLWSRRPAKSPVIVAYFLTFAICMAAQFTLPSAGPIFWARLDLGPRFAELLPLIPETSLQGSDYLWTFYLSSKEGIAVGISAWPSVHVSMAMWVVIAFKQLWPKLFLPAVLWYMLILFGSVYLGWHYLLDGLAGTVIALCAYSAAVLLCRVPIWDSPLLVGRLKKA